MSKAKKEKLEKGIVGVAGEYFVAAELSRRGYVASITLRNTRGIDVLASSADASRLVGIQVKCSQNKKKSWPMHEKHERGASENLFFVFINLKGEGELPDFHIVPSKAVADYIRNDHKQWSAAQNKQGGKHDAATKTRQFKDTENAYLDRWDVLGL
jgi:hypothetical protein